MSWNSHPAEIEDDTEWTAIKELANNGSIILDNNVVNDEGTGNFVELASCVTASSFTKTGVANGTSYRFKV